MTIFFWKNRFYFFDYIFEPFLNKKIHIFDVENLANFCPKKRKFGHKIYTRKTHLPKISQIFFVEKTHKFAQEKITDLNHVEKKLGELILFWGRIMAIWRSEKALGFSILDS